MVEAHPLHPQPKSQSPSLLAAAAPIVSVTDCLAAVGLKPNTPIRHCRSKLPRCVTHGASGPALLVATLAGVLVLPVVGRLPVLQSSRRSASRGRDQCTQHMLSLAQE